MTLLDFSNLQEMSQSDLKEVLEIEKYVESRLEYVNRKQSLGYKIVYPSDDELLIDIDDKDMYMEHLKNLDRLRQELPELVQSIATRPSSSGLPHRHVYVKLRRKISIPERILLQTMLASDPVREFLSMIRWLRGDKLPTLLAVEKENSLND